VNARVRGERVASLGHSIALIRLFKYVLRARSARKPDDIDQAGELTPRGLHLPFAPGCAVKVGEEFLGNGQGLSVLTTLGEFVEVLIVLVAVTDEFETHRFDRNGMNTPDPLRLPRIEQGAVAVPAPGKLATPC
jgi:hypothetical protein